MTGLIWRLHGSSIVLMFYAYLKTAQGRPPNESLALRNSASHEIITERRLEPVYSGLPAELSVIDEPIADLAARSTGSSRRGRKLPRIEQRDASLLEVAGVPGHNGQPMNQRRRGDERVPIRAAIRYVQLRAALGHGDIDNQDAARECRQDLVVEPGAESGRLPRVASFDQQDARFDLQDGNGGKEKASRRNAACPSRDALIRSLGFTQFRNDVRVEQIHQEKSAGR